MLRNADAIDNATNSAHVEYNETKLSVTESDNPEGKGINQSLSQEKLFKKRNRHCTIKVDTKTLFKALDKLDERFQRKKLLKGDESDNFDEKMLEMMLKTRGVAEREIHSAAGDPSFIPAGINLGGQFMMKTSDSMLFFHRMKLRNNTFFRVNSLRSNFYDMLLMAELSLNDLHLLGAYERAMYNKDYTDLFYTPTFGEVEFLLRNVKYKMEGRYRLLEDKLTIELVVSEIIINDQDMLMAYVNDKAKKLVHVRIHSIDVFLDRLKADLDKWLKDYFNDYLMYITLSKNIANPNTLQYDLQKTIALNNWAAELMIQINKRLQQLNVAAMKLPIFAITTVNGMKLKITNGILRGLDTIYKRSHATTKRTNKYRIVDIIVGFSSLKAIYQYEVELNTGIPPTSGMLEVSADELIAHMSVKLGYNGPNILGLSMDSIQLLKPESLTIEGPANRIIGNLKRILEKHVLSFVSNYIYYHVKMLGRISTCVNLMTSVDDEENVLSEENEKNQQGVSNEEIYNAKINSNDLNTDTDSSNVSDSKEREYINNADESAGDPSIKNLNESADDYILTKVDSVELEIPPKSGENEPRKIHLKHEERQVFAKNKEIK